MSPNANSSARTILVAEDEPDILELMMLLLTQQHYLVTGVRNGQAAVDAVLTDPFRLAILDVTMPVMDGLTAARIIQHERPQVLVGLHTAMDERWVREHFAGYSGYWVKPLDIIAFIQDLARLMP
jgi:CheY-like chemotaxis protein